MKFLLNIKKYIVSMILKFPFLFWAILLCYSFLVFMLGYTEREPSFFQYIFIGFSAVITLIIILLYYLLLKPQKTKKLKQWIKSNFSILKLNKRKFRLILILSNWGLLIGFIAFLCVLLKVHWIICLLLFIVQMMLAVGVFIHYISNFHKQLLLKKWSQGILFTTISLCLSFFCDLWSRNFVTSILFTLPEQLPTVTRGIYWFIFILCCCFISQWIAIVLSSDTKNKKIPRSLMTAAYLCILFVTAAAPQVLIINANEIVNKIVLATYESDMLPYFKCNDSQIIKDEPNQNARYLKIDDQEYRVIYHENDNINVKVLLCKEKQYEMTDI